MRHGAPGRRSRNNRGQGGGGQTHNSYRGGGSSGNGSNGNRMQVFDSNGPEVRIRGTAHQICEKYQLLARDAASQSNWVLSQSYLQHAEHYQRIINSWAAEPVRSDDRPVSASQPLEQEVSGNQRQTQDVDLGLPASILGQPVVQTQELADA
jgi:hypothetical protein